MRNPEPDWKPLLETPGAHRADWSDAHDLLLIDNVGRRRDLWRGLMALYKKMLDAGLTGLDLWIDGSMLTVKPLPGDVDCALWVPESHINGCTQAQYAQLEALADRAAIRAVYGVDLYVLPDDVSDIYERWNFWFSTSRDGTHKGFVVLTL